MSSGLASEVAGDARFPGYIFEPVSVAPVDRADRRPWGVYGRISKKDPREGAGASVKIEDQLDQGCEYIAEVDPGAECIRFRDNASAFLPDVWREDFERLLGMLGRGELKGVVSWHGDRLTRQTYQQAIIWRAVEKGRAQLHTVKSGWIRDPLGWQVEGLMSERESRVKQLRALDHHKRLAEGGKMHGGHRRFGYEPDMKRLRDGTTPVRDEEGNPVPGEFYPDEAGALREVAGRVLAGESLASCVRWLNGEDLPEEQRPRFAAVLGGKWQTGNLSIMLRRPMLAGLRVHEGRVVAAAEWPQVFPLETHEALVRKLGDPARRTSTKSNKSKYLLAGLATCAECGAVLRGRPGRYVKAETVYQCSTGRHVHRRTDVVDDALVGYVVARLSAADAAGVFVDESAEAREAALTVKRDALLARRKAYAVKAAREEIDAEMAAEVAEAIRADLAVVEADLDGARDARSVPLAALDGMTGPRAREAWDALSEAEQVGQQRTILRLLCSSITLAGGQREWEPERLLRVEWRDRPM